MQIRHLAFAAFVGVFVLAADAGASFVVAERGAAPACRIAVDAPWETAGYAAEELQGYIQRLTGVRLEISKAAAGGRIVLAPGAAELGEDGFRIVQKGDELRIEGGKRGVLYGAYDLLQTFGGVEWYASWFEEVPSVKRFEVPMDYARIAKPAIPVREVFWKDVLDNPVFWARLRLNCRSFRSCAAEKLGGDACRQSVELPGHSFNKLVPPEKYFKTHPEYYSEVAGKRIGERAQLCLTNPDVLKLVVAGVEKHIAREPACKVFHVAQNDWYNFCTCAKCRAIDEAEGSQAGTMIAFVNAVAEAIEKRHPDIIIATDAYQYTRKPPKTVRPRKNVLVLLCPIECDYNKSIRESRYSENIAFRKDIEGWAKLTDRLIVWDYTTDFEHFLVPFPNVKSLQDNIRFFRDMGAWRVTEQGAYRGWHGEFAELKAYLLAKWLWDPELPFEPLMDKFLTGYYGKAAPIVRRYFDSMYAFEVDEAERPLKIFDFIGSHPVSSSLEFLERSSKLWREAERAVADDPRRLYNVKMSAMPIDYVLYRRLYKRVDVSGAGTKDAWREPAERLAARMREAAAAGRPVRLCENNERHPKLQQALYDAADGKTQTVGDGIRAWQEESAFKRMGPKGATALVDDPDASGGRALKIANDNFQWYTTYSLDDVAFAPKTKYVLSVRLRAEVTGKPGEVVRIGIYDYDQNKDVAVKSFAAKDLRDGYADYDVATWEPSANQGFYIAAGAFDAKKQGRSAAHNGVWIDGFTLRRADAKPVRTAAAAAGSFNVTDYGAKGDGVAKDTAAIQKAIEAAAAAGGGTVELPAGTYLSGTIWLRDNVEVRLGPGAVLLASPDRTDYNAADAFPQNWASSPDGDNTSGGHLIVGVGVHNASLRGPGKIDGNSKAFLVNPRTGANWDGWKKGIPWRPGQMIEFVDSTDIRITDLEIADSPYWTCFLLNCTRVWIRGCYVHDVRRPWETWNGDGFDLDRCQHVTLSDCRIDTADDCITLRASSAKRLARPQDCAYVTIDNCSLSSSCNGIRFGVGEGRIHDVVVNNLVISDTRWALNFVAAYAKGGRGTDITDVRVSNLRVEAEKLLDMRHRHSTEALFDNIIFDGITARTKIPSEIVAAAERPFGTIVFRNVVSPAGFLETNAVAKVEGGDIPRLAK